MATSPPQQQQQQQQQQGRQGHRGPVHILVTYSVSAVYILTGRIADLSLFPVDKGMGAINRPDCLGDWPQQPDFSARLARVGDAKIAACID